ncbi:ATP-binding cassette domain-containing protein [Microbacterium sp. NPDC058342]|uniref:ATP-binding cassette domain-containing protein n=1 Tax=Microbacterium sp. NPDC058342 TaxID=3346454 RepID=UPI0036600358
MKQEGPLLRVRNLVKEYPASRKGLFRTRPGRAFRAVDDVSFELARGKTLAIVGESGSGKSTTARIVAKLLEPTAGSIVLEGQDVTRCSPRSELLYRGEVQMVFQDPFSSLNPRHTVEQIISAPLRYQKKGDRREHPEIVRSLLRRVGLQPEHAARHPWQFSGGQAQRISIARALAVDPKIVICDEAVSALDVSVQAQILDLLQELQEETGMSYIFITHDLAVVGEIAHDVLVMSRSKVVENGPRDRVLTMPQDPYTQRLLDSVPRINPVWDERRKQAMRLEV